MVKPMSPGGRLAVAVRSATWMMDDIAHVLPRGEEDPQDCLLLAKVLGELSLALRLYASDTVEGEQVSLERSE